MTVQDDGDARLANEAHEWIACLAAGEATTADAADFQRWRDRDAAHAAAFAAAAERWHKLGLAGASLRTGHEVDHALRRGVSRRALLGAGAAAAAAAGVAIAAPPWQLWPSIAELTADHRTATGEQRQVELGPSASVRLNTRTSIAVSSSPAIEEVHLIAGEAAFTAAGTGHQLRVVAGEGRSTAEQALFDIRWRGTDVAVSCFEGEVKIECGDRATIIRSREQLHYDGSSLGERVAIDPAVVGAWREGLVIFRNVPLAEVVAEINRYRAGRVLLLDRSFASRVVNGRFHLRRIDDALDWMQSAFAMKVRHLPGGIVLLG